MTQKGVLSSSSLELKEMSTVLAVMATVILWSSTFPSISAGLRGFEPLDLALVRFCASSIVFAGLSLFRPIVWPGWRDFSLVALCGLIGFAGYVVVLNIGQQTVTAGSASFMVNTVPLITAALSAMFLKERVTKTVWLSMTISFAGVGFIAFGESGIVSFNGGVLCVAIAALLQSVFFVLQKPLLRKYSPLHVTTLAMWAGTLALIPLAGNPLDAIAAADQESVLAVIYLGAVPGALGYVLWAKALASWPAARAASFLYIIPIFSVLIAWLWLDELPTSTSLLGGAVVLAGVALANRTNLGMRH